MCGGRKVVFNNRNADEGTKVAQVQQFLAHVASIGERNNGKPFIHKMQREIKKETEKVREQRKAVETTKLGEAELADKMQQLQMSHERTIHEMKRMVASRLRENSVKYKRKVQMLNENLERARRGNISLRNEHDEERRKQMMIGFAVPALGAIGGMCSIL